MTGLEVENSEVGWELTGLDAGLVVVNFVDSPVRDFFFFLFHFFFPGCFQLFFVVLITTYYECYIVFFI